jgi:FdhE protein
MAVTVVAAEPYAELRRRTLELRTRYGFARQLLDFYGALFTIQENAFHDARRLSIPLVGNLDAYVAEVVVPSVIDVTVAAGPDRLRSDLIRRLGTEEPREIVGRWMRSADQPLVDRYLARASLGPVLEALDAETRAQCEGPRDRRHCPECGGPPQLSCFEVAQEDLATGPRRLLCARCGVSWGYPRMTCASCGEKDTAKLLVFTEYGNTSGERGSVVRGLPGTEPVNVDRALFPNLRVEACESCRRYILSIDLAIDRAAVPLVDEMAAIPLDLYARERGFAKITPNLMGF